MKYVICSLLMFVLIAWKPEVTPTVTKSSYVKLTAWGIRSGKSLTVLHPTALFTERWDTLPQASFWRAVMKLSPDTYMVNTASSRCALGKIAMAEWKSKTDLEKSIYKEELRKSAGLDSSEVLNFTSGKNHFYKFYDVVPEIDKAIKIFEKEQTDPFFAQAILLIESPARMQKSTAGAYGPFQLMKSVAKHLGLRVSKGVDERANFDRAAWAAAKLIRTICIPYTNAMLEKRGIAYNPDDMWYKLLVMHVYHAGAGNVAPVLDVIGVKEGGKDLILKMWQTKCGHFGNSSQNYSQLVIAAMLELEHLVYNNCSDLEIIR